MPTYRFAALLWQDCVGTYTMVPVEAPNQSWAGHGSSPRRARESLRDLLTWLDCRNELPEPELLEASLHTYRVPVRPEYAARNRIYPCAEVWVPVPCVSGKTATDLRVAALPLLGVRFYYHEPGELKSLVIRYTQQQLKGQTPAQIAGYLPPRQLRLAEVVVRSRKRGTPPRPLDERWPALSQVAEPLGERAVRKQFAPAWERGALVQEVVRKLHHERASLVLVGEQGVGKSTVLVEAVQAVERLQAAEAKQRGNSAERTFWLTTGSRLIAGMKYLGQWEERCESIIDELARLPGVLCVDRLLELVRLGGVGPADSIAAFLVPYLRRGELRLVGEATPAELDACRRLLPEFADLLAILPVPAFDQAAALTVLDRSAERYAQNLRLEVAPGVSERTYRLFRRFQPYRALPGGAVHFLRDLCARLARERPPVSVTPASVVRHFVRRTGLPEWLLDDETPLDAATLKDDLRRQVIGQEEAVEAAARVVLTFKAGMHDPQ
ncbi:MAG: ATP-dependent Clp protease ATP-binding subunit, partial [Planctomycetia bacterium]|nr:ATP-dependent Clp protease ATP-binding subunit [Planctomycetia bacterium]